ncbi:MAG TPA: hypothetical protein PKK06_03140 [Phycisphaerae bacterium]|nr:hypothetical protein [Phycisphaerae bacterium]HNU44680.1 hypothetical protein [Phycisphaerae bacterium]
MTIELHCPICRKLIKAPDNAGGKQGKCPACQNLVYVPKPPEPDDEEIRIAPLDETDEERDQKLREEAATYLASLSRDVGPTTERNAPATPAGEVVEVPELVERYVLAMRDSKLDVVEETIKELRRVKQKARDYVQARMVDQMAPPLGNVPAPLLKGFLKSLLERLK